MHGDDELSQADPHFRDNILLYEYFHRDTGRGVGASHQTGWIGCVALLLSPENSPWWQFSAGLPSGQAAAGAVAGDIGTRRNKE